MDLTTLFTNLPTILIAFLGICFLIAFHELGHLLFAKLFNVYAPSFSIGFGPRLFEKKIGETTFALSAIPLGGYVEMAGSPEIGQGEQAFAHTKDERSFNNKPYWQKMIIISAGILFNIIFAYAALSFLFYTGGPCIGSWCNTQQPIINTVAANSPSSQAGLQAYDKIVSINNEHVDTIEQVITKLTPFMGKQAPITIERNGETKNISVELAAAKPDQQAVPRLGVYWHSPSSSITDALSKGWHATLSMIQKLFSIFSFNNLKTTKDSLGGPLMLIAQVSECAKGGYKVCLFMLAFISLNLAVFNMLPLPIFDGGQALFFTIEALIGKPLSDDVRHKIHLATWILVMALTVYLTYKDILKLFF
jgi:regulator of sigma E protease